MTDRKFRVVGEEHTLVLQLRRRRVPFDDIAKHLGITRDQAYEFYRQAIAALPDTQLAEHRAEELFLADDAVRDLLTIARDHAKPHTSVEAWNAIRGWSELKIRLLGLETPSRQQPEAQPGGLAKLRAAK
jgi:hypothetical protein